MKTTLLCVVAACLLFSSCATIFTGTKDRIYFNSTPSGATIYKDGVEQCITPCSVRLKRDINDTDLELKLDGYETRIFTLDKEFNIISILNLGNLLGWGIDAISGSLMKYDRKVYNLTLTEKKETDRVQAKEIHIDTKKRKVDVYVLQEKQ